MSKIVLITLPNWIHYNTDQYFWKDALKAVATSKREYDRLQQDLVVENKKARSFLIGLLVAEREGFEPPDP